MSTVCFQSQYPPSGVCVKDLELCSTGSRVTGLVDGRGNNKRGVAKSGHPSFNEPVGGRLIGVLYCSPRTESFQIF